MPFLLAYFIISKISGVRNSSPCPEIPILYKESSLSRIFLKFSKLIVPTGTFPAYLMQKSQCRLQAEVGSNCRVTGLFFITNGFLEAIAKYFLKLGIILYFCFKEAFLK